MNNITPEDEKQYYRWFYSVADLARAWDVSTVTVRKYIDRGDLRSVTIGTRRLVPADEVRRVEFEGLGNARKKIVPRTEVTT